MNAKASNDGVSEELAQAMRGEKEAQAEASRWKEKAVAAEELEGTNASTTMFFWRTDGRLDGGVVLVPWLCWLGAIREYFTSAPTGVRLS